MKYDELKAKAEKYYKNLFEDMWNNYDEYAKNKLITGYIFGYMDAEIDAINKRFDSWC